METIIKRQHSVNMLADRDLNGLKSIKSHLGFVDIVMNCRDFCVCLCHTSLDFFI